MKYASIERMYNYCESYIQKLNHNQRDALYEYFLMVNKECDHLKKSNGVVALLHEIIYIKNKADKDKDTVMNECTYEELRNVWSVMIGMFLVQDEYNKYNKNYKSKIR